MQSQPSQHAIYGQRYKKSRMSLLLIFICTAVNLLLLVTGSDTYYLFSAYVPYFIAVTGMIFCGRFPPEYYEDGLENIVFYDTYVFVILLIIAVISALYYLLAWILSNKNRVGWIIASLAVFGIDTAVMLILNGFAPEIMLGLVFHGLVIFHLITGVIAHRKLKTFPPEEDIAVLQENARTHSEESESTDTESDEADNSTVLRKADKTVKHRVFLEKRMFNMDICYQRANHTNELVINGNVYDEIYGVVEYPHTLNAFVDGHNISVGYTGTHSFISVDGNEVAKKLRIF